MDMDSERFKQLLDLHHSWPGPYTFKFIVPTPSLPDLECLFPAARVLLKPSANGTYTSLTATGVFESSHEVQQLYQKASQIEKIIML
jgi:hypothetical protein